MKYLRGPIVALLTFLISILVSPIHFQVQGWGCGRVTDGGGGYSITSYRSSYFVQLTFAHFGYDSPEKANAVFAEHLAETIQVIEVGPKLDKQGKIVGRRAVVITLDQNRDKQIAVVLWTEGKMLHAISSASLTHVLEFEKQTSVD